MNQQEIDSHTQTLQADRLQRGLANANRAASVTAQEIHAAGEHRRVTYEPAPDENSEYESLCRCHEDYDGQPIQKREEFDALTASDRWFPVTLAAFLLLLIVLAAGLYRFIVIESAEEAAIVNRVTSEQRRQMTDRQEIFSR